MSEITAWGLVIGSSLLCSTIAALIVHYLTKDRDVAGDYPAEFEALVKRAGEWRREDAEATRQQGQVLRDVLRDSIRKIYDYAKKTAA